MVGKRVEKRKGKGRRRGFRCTLMKSAQTTYVLVEVEERCHDGVLDGSQVGLVPVDAEHSSYATTTAGVTGDVLQ